MPRDRRDRSLSLDTSRLSPFPYSSGSKQSLLDNPPEDSSNTNTKLWEDARCPVCMEHPHNAILLMCSSHERGCRPFMCDTSYRHSNCFDQFRKSFGTEPPPPDPSEAPEKPNLVCPLCRGPITGWVVVEPARQFMNAKSRSCACESCDYSGTYKDLRRHARSVHPLVRPADVDPDRQHSWRRLERQRDLGDLLSTFRSSVAEERRGEEGALTIDEGGWLTVFFLVRFIGPRRSSERSGVSRGRSLRRLWGEAYDEEAESGGEEAADEEVDGPRRYVRRRLNRNNPDSQ
ncbi:Protein of unknown function (DUF1644 [Striga hermonthica]|uniref:Uncharacterized protein n=1 Tax=Striga hermonthica TaxID=68872 RepID=A0A9N7R9C4_STRHE|nr:Protein of unknown function (DUF1644 [Striga hermonthica]